MCCEATTVASAMLSERQQAFDLVEGALAFSGAARQAPRAPQSSSPDRFVLDYKTCKFVHMAPLRAPSLPTLWSACAGAQVRERDGSRP